MRRSWAGPGGRQPILTAPLATSPASHETRAQGQAICGVGPLNTHHHGYSSPPSRNLI